MTASILRPVPMTLVIERMPHTIKYVLRAGSLRAAGWATRDLARRQWVAKVQTSSFGALSTLEADRYARMLREVAQQAEQKADRLNVDGVRAIKVTEANHYEESEVRL